MSAISVLFYILSALAVLSAVGVITARNPVYSALSLVVTLVSIAGFYLLLNAEFLAVVQVLTYAGAILVLFVFMIMLLNLKLSELNEKQPPALTKLVVALVSGAAFMVLGFVAGTSKFELATIKEDFGGVMPVGRELFTQYVVPFEIAGVLLTVALVGAVLLAKKDLNLKKP